MFVIFSCLTIIVYSSLKTKELAINEKKLTGVLEANQRLLSLISERDELIGKSSNIEVHKITLPLLQTHLPQKGSVDISFSKTRERSEG